VSRGGTADAFQDLMPFNHCWGCGADNPAGLRLKSRWTDDDPALAIASFRPRPEHLAGPTHVLNGGIIATVLDCHGVCTAVADAYRRASRSIGTGDTIWFATGTLTVTYLKPAPVEVPAELKARCPRGWRAEDGRRVRTRLGGRRVCPGGRDGRPGPPILAPSVNEHGAAPVGAAPPSPAERRVTGPARSARSSPEGPRHEDRPSGFRPTHRTWCEGVVPRRSEDRRSIERHGK
jgi:acyl-coenzyme A thioesterase PaaI-like protein